MAYADFSKIAVGSNMDKQDMNALVAGNQTKFRYITTVNGVPHYKNTDINAEDLALYPIEKVYEELMREAADLVAITGEDIRGFVCIGKDLYRNEIPDHKFLGYYRGPQDARAISDMWFKSGVIVGGFPYFTADQIAVIENTRGPGCNHEYVNIGFTSIKLACKFCGKDM